MGGVERRRDHARLPRSLNSDRLAEDERRDLVGRLSLKAWDRVRVGDQGEAHGCVTQAFADDLGMNPTGESEAGVRVAEVMKADPR